MKALNFEEVKVAKQQLPKPKLRISLVLDRFRSDDNIAHAFRLADAFHIEHIYIIGDKEDHNWKIINRKSRSCSKHVPFTILESYSSLPSLKFDEILGLEWTDQSIDINKYSTKNNKLLLVLGNEKSGISQDLISLCTASVHIRMYGNNSSMNVMMATGIAVHQLIH